MSVTRGSIISALRSTTTRRATAVEAKKPMRMPVSLKRSTVVTGVAVIVVASTLLPVTTAQAASAPAASLLSPMSTASTGRSGTAHAPALPDQSSCLAGALQYRCDLQMPADPSVPYTMTVPARMTRTTIVMSGGNGANGDDNADGGQGGLVIAELSLVPGHQLQVWAASGANSVTPGTGWRAGGDGQSAKGTHLGSKSGGGGGASAIVDTTSGRVLAVAGGGGGGGGSWNEVNFGGQGGSAGSPAGSGYFGGTSGAVPSGATAGGDHDAGKGVRQGTPGAGGCEGGHTPGGDCSTSHAADSQGNGGDGGSDFYDHEGGGGGGAGYRGGNGGGQDSDLVYPAGGGGGGGGLSFVDTTAGSSVVAFGSTNTYQGTVTFSPAGNSTRIQCGIGNGGITNSTHYTVPAGVFDVYGVLSGGQGGTSADKPGPAGYGALAAGNIRVQPGEDLFLEAGCRGYGQNPSDGLGRSGGGGGGHDDGPLQEGDDGSGGGGGSAIVQTTTGEPLIQAGGGGGIGGSAAGMNGGAGGNAGLDWGQAGAGNGSSACGEASDQACTNPVAGGSGGNATDHPGSGDGDQGSSDNRLLDATGGGGGGGGGWVGGQGGDGGGHYTQGGGGGGAGSSNYAGTLVDNASIGTSTTVGDGFVAVLAIPSPLATPFDNNGIISSPPNAPSGSGLGFDNNGQWFSSDALAGFDFIPGQSTDGYDPVTVTWPNHASGQPDNYLAHGQTIPVTGTGNMLQVLGAATYAGGKTVGGTATINFIDGTTQQFNLQMADWAADKPARGNFAALDGVNTTTTTTVTIPGGTLIAHGSIWGQDIPIPTDKAVVSLTLPQADNFDDQGPTLHVFAAGVGPFPYLGYGYNNTGIATATARPNTGKAGGFDNNGDYYDGDQLAKNGWIPGAAVLGLGTKLKLRPGSLDLQWPPVYAGQPDNSLADGQDIRQDLLGNKDSLVVVGAASYGPATGTVDVTYEGGQLERFPFTFADWTSTVASPGTTLVYDNPAGRLQGSGVATGAAGQTSLFALTITMPTAKFSTIADVTVTGQDQYDATSTTLHVFAVGAGDSTSATQPGPSPQSTATATSGSRADTVVAPGDTLSSIAATHHVAGGAQAVLARNASTLADSDTLVAGQRLTVGGTTAFASTDVIRVTARSGPAKGLIDQIQAAHLNALVLQIYTGDDGRIATRTWSDGRPGMTIINESGVDITVSATRGSVTRFTTTVAAGHTDHQNVPR